jgi:predicted ester cyclase
LNACPDLHATVDDLLAAEADTVVARLTYRGTDTGGFLRGYPATGRPFEFGAIYIWRLRGGKLAELWQEADRVRLMQQLGHLAE